MGACSCSGNNNSPGTACAEAQEKVSTYEEWQFVTDAVGIGSAECARDYSFLKKHNFTHVVSIGTDFVAEFDDINYLIFNNILDAPFQSLNAVLKQVIEFITEAENCGRKVYIHCLMGLSRSSALLFGYVMFKKRIGYDQARAIVQKKRPMANPNLGFELQLRTFERANYDFAVLDNLCWERDDVWIPHIQEYAPVILQKALLIEEKFKQGRGNDVQNELMTLTFHFITIHNELDKMNAATRRTTDEFVKWSLKIQKKYIQDEDSYLRLTRFFNVEPGFEETPLRSLEEYEQEVEATKDTLAGNAPATTIAAESSSENVQQLTEVAATADAVLEQLAVTLPDAAGNGTEQMTEETPLIDNKVPGDGTY